MNNRLPFAFVACLFFCLSMSQVTAQQPDCACCNAEFQQFAFWEGDWEVFGHDGTKQGTNKIVFLQDKCVLQENWNGLTPNDAGTSYNFYNKEKKAWQQVWVSNGGGVLELEGHYIDSAMVLKSKLVKGFNKDLVINRITWKKQANGDVTQKWEVSSDKEKTWKIQFYGVYKLKTNLPDTLVVEKAKVTGIGGVFFKSTDPAKLNEWYKTNLGFETDQYGAGFNWWETADSTKQGFTQWSSFPDKTTYFEPSKKDFMINYRVSNLEKLIEELTKSGVTILDKLETYEYGKFIHILDLEGNKIELWEPVYEFKKEK